MSGAPDTSRGVAALYERHAAGWDEDRRHARPPGESGWIRRFASAAGAGGHVVDLGCGSGEPIGRDLMAAGLRVTGVDASPALIALCAQRFPEQEWLVADMRELALSRQFQGLVAWHSLFHLTPDDQTRMFPVFARHLAPGAPLMFTSGSRRDVTIGQWRGEALYHACLAPAEYQSLLDAHGFVVVDHVVEDESCGGATIWFARRAA